MPESRQIVFKHKEVVEASLGSRIFARAFGGFLCGSVFRGPMSVRLLPI